MSAPAAAADRAPKKKPGWMSIPGGPKEPKRDEFRNKLQAFSAQKSKLFDRLKEIRSEFDNRDDGANDLVKKERAALRARMNEIDAQRKNERDARKDKDQEIKKIRDKRREVEAKLRELSDDLGAFKTVSDIEQAIDHIMYKMETGAGSLASEKMTLKKLHQLEEAKTLLLEVEPLQNVINDAEDQEAELMQEYREIHERIGKLNKDYEENFQKKSETDKSVKKVDNRGELIKEREDIRSQLNTINEDMDKLRAAFDEQQKAWEEWRVVAQEKYKEKIEAERKARQEAWEQRERERKLARKKARMLKKLNPFEAHIAACSTLIAYLDDRQKMMKRDAERAEVQKKLATFDPATVAPKGAVLKTNDDDWLYNDRTGKNSAKAKAKAAKPAPAKKEAPKDAPKKEKYLQHSTEKHRLFEMTKTEVPLSTATIEETIKTLREKKKEYESHIKTDADIEAMTSEDDEEAEEAEEVAQE